MELLAPFSGLGIAANYTYADGQTFEAGVQWKYF